MITGEKVRLLEAIVKHKSITKGCAEHGCSRQYASSICSEFLQILNLDEVMSVKQSIMNGHMKHHVAKVKKDIESLSDALYKLEYFLSQPQMRAIEKIIERIS